MRKILYILVLITLVLFIDKINAYTEYKIGDIVPYNGMDFYVIKDSGSKEDSVTMLKAEPLTVDEVQQYSAGTGAQTDGYGGMQYHSSSSSYEGSYVKKTVDAWKTTNVPAATEARLIQYDEFANLGYEWGIYNVSSEGYVKGDNTPNWVYGNNYWYWTMSSRNDSSSYVWNVTKDGEVVGSSINGSGESGRYCVVRPVITLKKISLGDTDESAIDNEKESDNESNGNNTNETKTTVKVDNTYMSSSIILIILGFMIASVSVLIIYKLSNKKR